MEIFPYTWEIFRFFAENCELKSEVIGAFTQFPFVLAWAVTIHKSQGKTFAHGQVYVALSICTTLEGIILKNPSLKNIQMDWKIVDFLIKYQYKKSDEILPLQDKIRIIESVIKENRALRIVYLNPNNEKSERAIIQYSIEEM